MPLAAVNAVETSEGWAIAVRQRRKALIQRTGVGAGSALVVSPLLGWEFAALWCAAYFLIQLLELMVFGPINSGRTDRMGLVRSTVGGAVLFLNTALYGGLSVPLWLAGGPMGGICAAILLPAAMIYSMVNSPRSMRVLLCTVSPQFVYLAATPWFMSLNGASPAYVTAAAASALIFITFCLTTWQRMTEAARAADRARVEAVTKRQDAERAMSAHSAFLAAVGHDLRTPISAILTGAAQVERGEGPPRAHAQLIADAGLMMKALLDDLLDHSKIDAGRMTVEQVDFNPRSLMAQTLRLWQGPARDKGLRLKLEGSARLPASLRGDAMRVRQILNNLMSNAMKFTQDGGITVRIDAWDDEPTGVALVIEIADTGPGMTTEQMARLFTPFDQTGDGVSARYGGSGLGLSISRELAQLMGGRLTARSAPGQGARFTLALTLPRGEPIVAPVGLTEDDSRAAVARALSARAVPATPASEIAPTPRTPPVVEAEAATPPETARDPEPDAEDRPLRVLVVDDHDINRRAIQLILQPLGCDIATAEDGLKALDACGAEAFDVIFMDVRMPELDGRETTRRLRAGGGPNAATPVIAVTADTQPEDVAACTAAGMDYFVSKPLTPQTLLGALEQVLSQPSEAEISETAAA